MQRKIICLYSGGAKSVATLLAILANEQYRDYTIQVHYINIINHTGNFRSSINAVNKTLSEIKKLYTQELIISENQVNFSCLPSPSPLPADIDICAFIASQMLIIDPSIRYIAMGLAQDNLGEHKLYGNTLKRAQAYLDMTKHNPHASPDAEYLLPLMSKTREQICAALPPSLAFKY